jgi:preprotein translocase subunit SecE
LETSYRKFTVLSLLVLSALFGYLVFEALTAVLDAFRLTTTVTAWMGNYSWNVVGGVASSAIALIGFVGFANSAKVVGFGDEVFAEVKKVTWPNRQDTTRSTIVVVIMVTIAGVFLLVVDNLWNWIFQRLLF